MTRRRKLVWGRAPRPSGGAKLRSRAYHYPHFVMLSEEKDLSAFSNFFLL